MTIQHSAIPDAQLHEPKGVVSATSGAIYVADGAGSGSWNPTIINTHGQMVITANAVAKAMTAAVDPTLNTNTDYVKMTGAAFPWTNQYSHGVTFSTDKMVLTQAGYYIVSFWGAFLVAATNTFIGVKYAIDDTPPYSVQKLISQSTTANDYKNMSATSILGPVTAGQTISMYLASSNPTNVTLKDGGLMVAYLHA